MNQRTASEPLAFLLADTARLLRAAFADTISTNGIGVTPGEAGTLLHIDTLGQARQVELADRMGVEPMTLSGYVDRLEAQGLAVREPDADDRRAKIVRLTDEGRVLAQTIRPLTRQLIDDLLAPLGEGGGDRLRNMLGLLRASLQERRNGR